MNQSQQFRPAYGASFRCIGSACEDTCCHGWSIPLDKQTYEKYRSLPAGPLRVIADEQVSVVPSATADSLYASIALTQSKDCSFFTTDRLCGLQKEYGEAYLSSTCSIYPRVLNEVQGNLELSLYLSCPEAARNVLLTPEFLSATPDNASPSFRTDQVSKLGRNGEGLPYKPFAYFQEIRSCVVALLQDRNRPIWQRIFLIGALSAQLDEVSNIQDESKVPGMLAAFGEIIRTGSLLLELERIQTDSAKQLDTVLRLADLANRTGISGRRFQACFQMFIDGIGYTAASVPEDDLKRYLEADNLFCKPLLQQHPHILENYLLNYVYRTLFPFGREASAHSSPRPIFREYLLLASQYLLVRGLLAGVSGRLREQFSTNHVIEVVQSFSKTVEHSPRYLEQILELLDSQNLAGLETIGAILPR